ncbi:MAG: DNA polymerase III subunit alpha [Clostridia bacterium]
MFVHLHCHSEYSLLDGAVRIKDLIKSAKEMHFNAVALTDHGVMSGVVDFYKLAKENGIKPIIGCEVYTAKRTRFDKQAEYDSTRGHLVLLCKNNEGYENLMAIVSKAHVEGFYKKPRVDMELLKEYSSGLIALSGCLAGDIPNRILNNDYNGAISKAKEFNDIFGQGNFYLEMQNHNLENQLMVNSNLINISKELNIPLVATNDVHYLEKSNAKAQSILMCIQTGKTIEEGSGIDFGSNEFYFKSQEQMEELFQNTIEAVENTIIIADECNVELDFTKLHLPSFIQTQEKTNYDLLLKLANEGFYKRYEGNKSVEYLDRLNFELDTIKNMGFVDYFLIVYDYVKFARDSKIPVGPGRGSAAGSIVSYCLNITNVDPMKYDLLFERFLNPERITMPDIDIDFCYERRQEVIDYVINKYGKDKVAQIITFGTMMAKQVIRDVGRVLNISYSEVDKIAKLIPNEKNVTIKETLKFNKTLADMYNLNMEIKELLDFSMQLEGLARHASTHAAGVVVTAQEVYKYVPLQKNDEAIVTGYPMNNLEELGLLKMDFLGLRYLTIINDTEKAINKTDSSFKISEIKDDDSKVFALLSSGKTLGLFQLESQGMRKVLATLAPETMEDIIAVISLYRPGPMKSIPTYINNRHNTSKIKYKHQYLEDILDVTYGCIVYQEQVMKIVQKLAGYSFGRADLVRRAMSKKKIDVMEKERHNFIYGLTDENGKEIVKGAIKNGVSESIASEIFDEISTFAEYAFNKSHAAAYAVIAYQTAYLKAHYKEHYMAALLTSVLGRADKVYEYISECEQLSIKVLPPDINYSEVGFVCFENNIRFGLVAIKNVGSYFIEKLIIERKNNGLFTSFYDFIKRMYKNDLNKRCVESLIKCGAFDSLKINRRTLLSYYEKVIDDYASKMRNNVEGQIDLFANSNSLESVESEFNELEEFPKLTLLKMEKEMSSIYFSGHPMSMFKRQIKEMNAINIKEIVRSFSDEYNGYKDGNYVEVAGIITAKVLKTTKNNDRMAFITIEDMTGSIECIVFPNVFSKSSQILTDDTPILISGVISSKEDEAPKIIAKSILLLSDIKISPVPTLFLKLNAKDDLFYEINDVLKQLEGNAEVVYVIKLENKKLKAKFRTNVNDALLNMLYEKLGKENVVFKNI